MKLSVRCYLNVVPYSDLKSLGPELSSCIMTSDMNCGTASLFLIAGVNM